MNLSNTLCTNHLFRLFQKKSGTLIEMIMLQTFLKYTAFSKVIFLEAR